MDTRELTPSTLSAQRRKAANLRWAFESDRMAATAPGRKAAADRFVRQVDPTGELSRTNPEELAKRVDSLKRAFYAEMGIRSGRARRDRSKR